MQSEISAELPTCKDSQQVLDKAALYSAPLETIKCTCFENPDLITKEYKANLNQSKFTLGFFRANLLIQNSVVD